MVVYSTTAGDRLPELVLAIGAAGLFVVATALGGRWPALLPWGIAGVASSYAVFLGLRAGSVDARAPLIAGGFFAAAELGYWSLEHGPARPERVVILRRVAFVGFGALAAALLGSILLVAASSTSGGVAWEAFGVAAAVVALGIVVLLAARTARERT